ncbi:DUF1501 domain-containing protein [Oxalobacteraceae bacterium A2-2]
MTHIPNSRRHFIGNMLTLAGGSAIPFSLNLAAMGTAAAQTAADYKALVCVFLTGGNDAFNTVLATDSTSWSEYRRLRATGSAIALAAPGAAGGVLPITPTTAQSGRTFALHPSLQGMKTLFDNGSAAIVANVGPLVQPLTKAQYLSSAYTKPSKLFSHNDQQATWQTLAPEGSQSSGWGGRFADMMASANTSSMYTAISAYGNAMFLSGRTVQQFQVSPDMAPIANLNGTLFGASGSALRNIITADSTDAFQKEHAAVMRRAITSQASLSSAMLPAGSSGVPNPPAFISPVTGASSVNPLAVQLQTVARMIGARNAMGLKRQVFYVNLGGFDTHDAQVGTHSELLAKLAHAMTYFDSVLATLQGADMRKQVTTFTASDFGRTFSSNGDGTDHGWGSHHFVIGGAVKGKNIYGTMPVTGVGHAQDVGSGALLPSYSVEQYGATLASWFGLSATQLTDVFPNLVNFSNRNLGFMA